MATPQVREVDITINADQPTLQEAQRVLALLFPGVELKSQAETLARLIDDLVGDLWDRRLLPRLKEQGFNESDPDIQALRITTLGVAWKEVLGTLFGEKQA